MISSHDAPPQPGYKKYAHLPLLIRVVANPLSSVSTYERPQTGSVPNSPEHRIFLFFSAILYSLYDIVYTHLTFQWKSIPTTTLTKR